MEFFLDRNLSPKLVHVLGQLGVTAIHQNQNFPRDPGDPEIIAFVKEHNLVLVTCDRGMLHRHTIVLSYHQPLVVFLSAAIQRNRLDTQRTWFVDHWLNITHRLESLPMPGYLRVTLSGNVQICLYP